MVASADISSKNSRLALNPSLSSLTGSKKQQQKQQQQQTFKYEKKLKICGFSFYLSFFLPPTFLYH